MVWYCNSDSGAELLNNNGVLHTLLQYNTCILNEWIIYHRLTTRSYLPTYDVLKLLMMYSNKQKMEEICVYFFIQLDFKLNENSSIIVQYDDGRAHLKKVVRE